MKFIKNFFTVIFFTLFVLSGSLLLFFNVIVITLFDDSVPAIIIDSIDINKAAESFLEASVHKEKDEAPEAGSVEDLQNSILEVTNSFTDTQEQMIKDDVKNAINELIIYLRKEDKKDLVFNIKNTREIIILSAVKSEEFQKRANLAQPICQNNNDKNCIEAEDIANLINKIQNGSLTRQDVTNIIPICSTANTGTCVTEQELNSLLDQNENTKESSLTSNPLISDEIRLVKDDIPLELRQLKVYTSVLSWIVPITILLFIIFITLFLLLKGLKGLLVGGIGFGIILLILAFVYALTLFNQTQSIDMVKNSIKNDNEYMVSVLVDAMNTYIEKFQHNLLIFVIIVFSGCFVFIASYILFSRLRKRRLSTSRVISEEGV